MEFTLNEEASPTRSNLFSVLKYSSLIKYSFDDAYTSAFKDLLGYATWKPCKKRKKIILVKNQLSSNVTPPCFNKNGKCLHCKSKIITSGFKMPQSMSLFHRQCLHLLGGEQNLKGEFVSIKYIQ